MNSTDPLEIRLARFLLTEHRKSRRETLLLHELTVEERVSKGVCLSDMKPIGKRRGNRLAFHFPPQGCKLRQSDWMVLSKGRPVGPEVARGAQVIVAAVDPLSRTLELEPVGRQWEGLPSLDGEWTLDYLSSDMNAQRLAHVIDTQLAGNEKVSGLLQGHGWANVSMTSPVSFPDLDQSQARAANEALGGEFTLIHGPPGTGKTRVLASIIRSLNRGGIRVLVSAFTHRAIDNVLSAVRQEAPDMPIIKLGRRSEDLDSSIQTIKPFRFSGIPPGSVIGATVYALARINPRITFDVVIIDEASQLPVAHSVLPLLRGTGKLILAGDHRQLPPVRVSPKADPLASRSIFEHLAEHYPERCFLLTTSYRLPPTLCLFPSETFYHGSLASSQGADPEMPSEPKQLKYPGLRPLWQLQGPLRTAWVNHAGYGAFSPPEAETVARIVSSLVQDFSFDPEKIAVVAPHRAQVREITDRVWRHLGAKQGTALIVDTVERMQGQERDVIVLSLCASDEEFILGELEFILSPNRMNVAMTRARRLLLVVGSRRFFRVFPTWPEELERAALFRRWESHLLPFSTDLTAQAHQWVGLPSPEPPALPSN